MDHKQTNISIHVEADYNLSVNEIWPDGDAPDEITAEAVKAVMLQSGSRREVLNDWCLDNPTVSVAVDTPNPARNPDDPLFPLLAPSRWLHSHAEVWK